jgi:hypothetical protein
MSKSARYVKVNADVFNAVASHLAQFGLEISGNQGSISKMGVSADYHYEPATETLEIKNVEVGMPASFAGFSTEKVISQITEKVIGKGGQQA